MRRRPTIRDVAALAGTSVSTVSRVVNGESSVTPALTAKVQRAVGQIGYQQNVLASNLRRRESRPLLVGLLLSNVANPLDAAIHRAIEDATRFRGISVLASSVNEDGEVERDLVAAMAQRQVDGIIMMPAAHTQSYLLEQRRMGMHFVFIDRPPAFLDADTVTVDNVNGAQRATEHLLNGGHRRIAYLGDRPSITTAVERHCGFVDAFRALGAEPDQRLVHLSVTGTDHARRLTHELIASSLPPTALFASQNLLAIGVARALRELGLRREVALVSFDDVPFGEWIEPGLTAVCQDPEGIGTQAAELLLARIDGHEGPSVHRVVPTRLAVRGSGEISPR